MMNLNTKILTILAVVFVCVSACENVEDGYRINYEETPAQFTVDLLSSDRGAIDDTISFSIYAKSDVDIRSLVTVNSVSGTTGTGYAVESTSVDPLIDHLYGTIQPGTKELNLKYHYVVGQDSLDPKITFTLVDDLGKKTITYNIYTVPSIVRYSNVAMYTQTPAKADGFSSIDGEVYHDLSKYTEITVANEAIQEAIDIVPIINGSTAMLAAPYNGNFWVAFSVRNKTLFKLMEGIDSEDFDQLTNATLSSFVEDNEVKNGSTVISDIKVGDIIGFRTDFASTNPYHYGIIRIKAIHPTNVEYYQGTSYLIEMDIATQK